MENKSSKYFKYAIGEIVLVVLGILIALQINNWNTKRIEKTVEEKYLKNIVLDLKKDLASLSYQLEFRTKKFDGTKKLIDQINGKPVDDLTELTFNVVNSLMEERFTPNNATYNELASSGNLNIISNDSIKILLLELEEDYKYNQFGIEHETYEYREYISKPLFKFIQTEQLVPVYFGDKTVEEQGITRENFDDLFNSPEYKNGLYITNVITGQLIPFYKEIEAKSKRIIEMIEKDLND